MKTLGVPQAFLSKFLKPFFHAIKEGSLPGVIWAWQEKLQKR